MKSPFDPGVEAVETQLGLSTLGPAGKGVSVGQLVSETLTFRYSLRGVAWRRLLGFPIHIIGNAWSRDFRRRIGRLRHLIVQVEPARRSLFEFVENGVVGVDADLVLPRFEDHVTQP